MPALLPDKSTWSLIKRLAGTYLRPYSGQLALALFFMFIAAAMTAAFAKLIQPVLDDVLYGKKVDMILPVAGALFAVFVTRGFATYLHTIMMYKIGQSVVADVQNALFARFMGLDLKFFHENPSGQLISRVISDVNVMRIALSDTLTGFGKSLLTLLFLIVVMFSQDWKLALAAFTIFPFAAGTVAWIGRRLRKVSGGIQAHMASLSDLLSQIFQGVRLVKAYAMEEHEKQRAGVAVEKVKRLMIKSIRIGNLSTPVNEFLAGGTIFGVIVYGGYQVAADNITPGALMSFIAAFTLAYEPMKKLARLNNSLQMGLGAAERVLDMLDHSPDVTDRDGAIELSSQTPDITFEKVEFQYHDDEKKALSGVSFKIPKGKVTALVGPSGGGKTTILNLIPRFYDVTQGRVLIDGTDIRDVTIASLRKHIALVSQDITLFDDTIRANIAYGSPDATDEAITKAAKAAAADEFIRELPDGYDTRAGEDGVKLSGGQRQRIAIARAILHDAPILLLDEATSALDTEAERAIQAALQVLQKGKTTLVIAHRLSTIQNANQILVLQNGQVIEKGKHDELMEMGGLYARMYHGVAENEE